FGPLFLSLFFFGCLVVLSFRGLALPGALRFAFRGLALFVRFGRLVLKSNSICKHVSYLRLGILQFAGHGDEMSRLARRADAKLLLGAKNAGGVHRQSLQRGFRPQPFGDRLAQVLTELGGLAQAVPDECEWHSFFVENGGILDFLLLLAFLVF